MLAGVSGCASSQSSKHPAGLTPDELAILAVDPGAAQVALNDEDRLAYLLGANNGFGASSDQGTGLGKALEAATTVVRNRQTDRQVNRLSDGNASGQVSAEIATKVFSILGQTQASADRMPTGLKASVSVILADYMPDVYPSLLYPDTPIDPSAGYRIDNEDFTYPPFGALITESELDNLMHSIGRDPDDVKIVGAGWVVANRAFLGKQIGDECAPTDPGAEDLRVAYWHGRVGITPLVEPMQLSADVFNKVLQGAYAGSKSKLTREAYAAQMKKDILDISSSVPITADRAVFWGADGAIQAAIDYARTHPSTLKTTVDWSEIENDKTDIQRKALAQLVQVMYQCGFWDPDVISAYNQPPGQLPLPQVDWLESPTDPRYPGLVNPDGTLDTTSPSYDHWIHFNVPTAEFSGYIRRAFIDVDAGS